MCFILQKIKKSGQKSSNYLIASPKQLKVSKREIRTPGSNKKSLTPRTPRCRRLVEEASPNMRVTPKSTRRISPCRRRSSSSQWRNFTNLIGNEGLLRRSVRAASLNSPYASPATLNRRFVANEMLTDYVIKCFTPVDGIPLLNVLTFSGSLARRYQS